MIAVLIVALTFLSESFLTWRNLHNILNQNAPLAIMASAMTLVIIAGGFESLRSRATFAVGSVVSAWIALHVNPYLGLVLAPLRRPRARDPQRRRHQRAPGAFVPRDDRDRAHLQGGSRSSYRTGASSPFASMTSSGLDAASSSTCSTRCVVHGDLRPRPHLPPQPDRLRAGGCVRGRRQRGGGGALRDPDRPRQDRHLRVRGGSRPGLPRSSRRRGSRSGRRGQGREWSSRPSRAVILGGTSIYGGAGAVWRSLGGVFLLALIISNGFNILNADPFYRDLTTGLVILAAIGISVSGPGAMMRQPGSDGRLCDTRARRARSPAVDRPGWSAGLANDPCPRRAEED